MSARTRGSTISKDSVSEQLGRLRALEVALQGMPVGVGLFHIDGRPIYVNEYFRSINNIAESEDLVPDLTFENLIDSGRLDHWKTDPRRHFEMVRAALADGRSYEAEIEVGDRIIAVHDVLVEDCFILTTQQDITDRVKAQHRVAHLARHDPLTDLPNRAAFSERLAAMLDQAAVRQQKFALLSVDLDRFKDVNDVFGHGAGDALLREVSARFRECAGDNFVARQGGDEFILINFDPNQPEAAGALANRIFETATGEFHCAGHTLMVNLSIGIAIYPDDGSDAETLLTHADSALYRAKQDGRGVTRSFSPKADRRIREQRKLQQELRFAISRNEFALHFQPQSTVSGEITGFEALLRWRNPRRGTVEPEAFIPLAEDNGQIVEIGEWVLREACREAASWANPLRIAVNLSPVQFRHGDIASLVHTILLETGLAPGRLEVEITESILIDSFSRAVSLLRRIKSLGVHIAMDDFGTGYSSLAYLQAFPFDTLKIDRSFIARLGATGHANEIVRAVIGLGRGLKLPIIAEGVETREQLEFLAREHCQTIQGNFFGDPRPIEEYAAIVGRPAAREAMQTATR